MALLRIGTILAVVLTFMNPKTSASELAKSAVQVRDFGSTGAGQKTELYILTNHSGMEVAITNFGATIVSLKVPDRNGKLEDVVLGYDTVKEYESGKSFFGATIGRYGNRIAHGKFTLAGQSVTLPKNDGENTLHGGLLGFNKRIWTAKELASKEGASVEFSYLSTDGEEGFPGNLTANVVFTLLRDKNELRIDYSASTDKLTVANLTNHSYFNLAGQGNGDILSQMLMLNASKFTPVDATLIPSGELCDVKDTPFDFRQPVAIGARINGADEQLRFGKGYDHNWVLDKKEGSSAPTLAATVSDPSSGRVLEVLTTEPGVQFYSGNFLDDTVRGKGNKPYPFRSGLCLETQHFPDSPNHGKFPSTTLAPGTKLYSTTILRFSAK